MKTLGYKGFVINVKAKRHISFVNNKQVPIDLRIR